MASFDFWLLFSLNTFYSALTASGAAARLKGTKFLPILLKIQAQLNALISTIEAGDPTAVASAKASIK